MFYYPRIENLVVKGHLNLLPPCRAFIEDICCIGFLRFNFYVIILDGYSEPPPIRDTTYLGT
jgi:hypothetical protein